jgi:ATP-dependent protease Clp ATPase subunit
MNDREGHEGWAMSSEPTCSFCGRPSSECKKWLIVAPFDTAAICWECIRICIESAEDSRLEQALASTEAQPS